MITEDPLKYLCRDWFRPGAASNDEARNSEHLQRDGSGCLVVPWLSSPLINDLNCLRRTSLEELRQGAAMDEALLVQDKKKTSVTGRSIERNLQKLQQAGALKRIGPAKGGRWEVVDD